MKSVTTILSAVLLSVGLVGCNTLEGFGKDLTEAGNALSGAASKDDKKAQPAAAPASTSSSSSAPAPAPQRR